MQPDVRYARSGDVSVAYQVVGDHPLDLVVARGSIADLSSVWDQPLFVRHIERLASFSRVILFDKRGSGLSDRVRGVPTLETRMDDVRAVLDDAGSRRAAIWAAAEGARLAVLFAATYPERATALVLYDPSARGTAAPDYPWGPTPEESEAEVREVERRWGERDFLLEELATDNPTAAADPDFREWIVTHLRRSASPAAAAAFWRMQFEGDVRDVLGAVRAPTLVLHRESMRPEAQYVAARIPDARRVEIPGLVDSYTWADPERNRIVLDETERFLADVSAPIATNRVLATILFTDIVGSTQHAAAVGDAEWARALERHHSLVREQLGRYRGDELDTAGDGFFAAFDGPARAVECALAIRDRVHAVGVEIRGGVHTGECERVDGKLGGIAVATGARIAAAAGAGEVLVSRVVRDLVGGSGLRFEDRGAHDLKGIGSVELFAAAR